MITFNCAILKHHKKEDGTWNIKIRVTYNRRSSYLPTNMFVSKDDLNTKKNKITNKTKLTKVNATIEEYRNIAEDIAITSALDTAKIISFIKKAIDKKQKKEIDFIAFVKKVIEKRKKDAMGKVDKTATGYQTVINSLQDFFKSEQVLINEIDARSLKRYQEYLQTERKVTRKDRFGKPYTQTLRPMGNGINNYMRDIRALFNDAMEEFNGEDNNDRVITHYPFKKYKIPKPTPAEKKSVKAEVIKKIRDYKPTEKEELMSLGQEVFMLAFYLVGINLVDLFETDRLKKGRLTYNRSKTKGRRDDKAFISIKVEPEALQLLSKYADPDCQRIFNFYHRYSTLNNFTKAVNKGLKQLSKELQLPRHVTSGYARTSWATIARNKCGISKDDVDLALNHVDPRHKLADIYIEKDFTMIDESNRKVLDTLRD